MKNLLKASILVLAFCICAFGQTNNIPLCPTITVTGPSGIVAPEESIFFTVHVNGNGNIYNLKYNWTVLNGEIISGQKTEKLEVLQKKPGDSTTATVEISGQPRDCINTASESYMYCPGIPLISIEEFLGPFSKIDEERITAIVRALQNDPTAQLYVIFRHKEKTSPKMASQKERDIFNSLIKNGLDKDRIIIIKDFGQKESVEFLLVPAGANPPQI